MSIRSYLAPIAILIGAMGSVAHAATINLGDVSAGGTFGGASTGLTSGSTNMFDDKFSFASNRNILLNFSILTSVSLPSALQSVSYDIFSTMSSTPVYMYSSPTIASNVASQTGNGISLAAGSYYFDLFGTTSSPSSVTNTVNFGVSAAATVPPVPLPPALPLFASALVALGAFAFFRRRKAGGGAGDARHGGLTV